MKKKLCLLLCLLMLFPYLTACGNEGPAAETEAQTTTALETEVETEPETTGAAARADIPDSLPADLDFGGATLNIFYFGHENSVLFDGPSELTGDVVKDALYNRNISVEERLNVSFNWVKGSDSWDKFPQEVMVVLRAGAADYDIIMEENSRLFQQSLKGYFYDMMERPYIDLAQPWWYSEMMEECSLDNSKRYFIIGDICLTTLINASAAFVNKEIYTDYFGSVEELYEKVLDGHWTMDAFMELCRGVATDLNGDNVYDNEDLLGFRFEHWGIPNFMSLSNGLSYSTRDEEGFPVLELYTEQTVDWADKLYKILYTDNMSVEGDKLDSFRNGTSLFLINTLASANDLRDVNFSYGILPYPKLSEEVETFSGAAVATGNGVAIPVSAPADKLEAACAAIEALCAQGYRTVTPAWYETALKIKYADSSIDAQMVDFIYNTIRCPFIAISAKVTSIGDIFTNSIYGASSEGTFTSYWNANKKSLQAALDKVISDYKSLDEAEN